MPEDPESIASPILRAGYNYWLSKKKGKLLPGRGDIDPAEMRPFLSWICLLDVKRDPIDFRYRLIGTEFSRYLARDYTGTWMSELPHQQPGSIIFDNLCRVMAEKKPLFYATPYVGPHRDIVAMHDMSAPLAADGVTVDMMFVVVDFAKK